MQHSWYLAADFQLSTIGLVLVTLVIRFPRLKKPLITIVTAIAVIIPGVVVYLGSYEGVTIFSPEYSFTSMFLEISQIDHPSLFTGRGVSCSGTTLLTTKHIYRCT